MPSAGALLSGVTPDETTAHLDRIEARLSRRMLDPVGWAQSAPSDQGWLLALARRLLGGCAPGGGVTDCAQDEAPGTAT